MCSSPHGRLPQTYTVRPAFTAVAVFALCLLLSGGATRAQSPTPLKSVSGVTAPIQPPLLREASASETYLGMFVCTGCSGSRVELSLYRNGSEPGTGAPAAYHLRETAYGLPEGDRITDSNGFWLEHTNAHGEDIVELASGRPGGMKYLRRVETNGGELLALDGNQREIRANVPHTLARITGSRQLHMLLFEEPDNGRRVELKPGEVFEVSLLAGAPPGYTWSCDRPDASVLVEVTGSAVASYLPRYDLESVAASLSKPVPALTPPRRASRPPPYAPADLIGRQVWQLIAPPAGTLELHFAYTKAVSGVLSRPIKLYTLTIVTR